VLEVLATTIMQKKASKRHKDQEEEIILFAEDITVYVENSKGSPWD